MTSSYDDVMLFVILVIVRRVPALPLCITGLTPSPGCVFPDWLRRLEGVPSWFVNIPELAHNWLC